MTATIGFYDSQQGTTTTRWSQIAEQEVVARVFDSVAPSPAPELDEEDRVWDSFFASRLTALDELANAAIREFAEGRTRLVGSASR